MDARHYLNFSAKIDRVMSQMDYLSENHNSDLDFFKESLNQSDISVARRETLKQGLDRILANNTCLT